MCSRNFWWPNFEKNPWETDVVEFHYILWWVFIKTNQYQAIVIWPEVMFTPRLKLIPGIDLYSIFQAGVHDRSLTIQMSDPLHKYCITTVKIQLVNRRMIHQAKMAPLCPCLPLGRHGLDPCSRSCGSWVTVKNVPFWKLFIFWHVSEEP